LLPFVEIDELVEALAIDISSDGDLATLSLVLGASDLVPLDALSSARYFWLGIDCNLLLLLPVVIRTSPALSSSSFSEVKLWPFIFFRLAGGLYPCTAAKLEPVLLLLRPLLLMAERLLYTDPPP